MSGFPPEEQRFYEFMIALPYLDMICPVCNRAIGDVETFKTARFGREGHLVHAECWAKYLEADELYQIHKALEAHGIVIDQVDMDQEGHLYRWIIQRGSYKRESLERWHNPGDALKAALTHLLGE